MRADTIASAEILMDATKFKNEDSQFKNSNHFCIVAQYLGFVRNVRVPSKLVIPSTCVIGTYLLRRRSEKIRKMNETISNVCGQFR